MPQPIDVKVDEETLMKLVPFWRASLAPSGAPSTQFYFRHFEVHPIKVTCSSFFLLCQLRPTLHQHRSSCQRVRAPWLPALAALHRDGDSGSSPDILGSAAERKDCATTRLGGGRT
jgi:hypothetical protein